MHLKTVAPFTVVNLAAGASGIKLSDFLLGSLLGMAPGMVLLSFVGDRIVRALAEPSFGEIAMLILCVVGYVGLALGAQSLLTRWRGRGA